MSNAQSLCRCKPAGRHDVTWHVLRMQRRHDFRSTFSGFVLFIGIMNGFAMYVMSRVLPGHGFHRIERAGISLPTGSWHRGTQLLLAKRNHGYSTNAVPLVSTCCFPELGLSARGYCSARRH
jgi:hypothetical protein